MGTEYRGSGGIVGGLTSHPQKIKKVLTNSKKCAIMIAERKERGRQK